ncbi:MAG: class I SAM-dependent methyltransferase, partial [Chloroflexi bacterium]|nr:class I SAM-dependent methyltransferase [Chloroflexota bacterium]
MTERRFAGKIESLHAPERIALLEIERVVDHCLEGITGGSTLDVGTGGGLFAKAFAQRGAQVAGVDISPEMLAAARSFLPEGDFRQAPAEALPFADDSFDLVFMGHVFHEVDDYVKALKEARRVSFNRIAILEWPYREHKHGPPLDHRLQPRQII